MSTLHKKSFKCNLQESAAVSNDFPHSYPPHLYLINRQVFPALSLESPPTSSPAPSPDTGLHHCKLPPKPLTALITSIPTAHKRWQPTTKSLSLSTESHLQDRWQRGQLIVGYPPKTFLGAQYLGKMAGGVGGGGRLLHLSSPPKKF